MKEGVGRVSLGNGVRNSYTGRRPHKKQGASKMAALHNHVDEQSVKSKKQGRKWTRAVGPSTIFRGQ